MKRVREFLAEEAGQDLIEYCFLIGAITLAAAASIMYVGSDTNTLWTTFNSRISGS
jgi:Flp pilus assembly pilin Flp